MRLDHLFTSVLFLSVVPRALSIVWFMQSTPDACTGGQYAVGVGMGGFFNATGMNLIMTRSDSNGNEVVMLDETTDRWGTAGGCTEAFEETTVTISEVNPHGCDDTANGAVDAYGDGCAWYDAYPSDCGGYDTALFNSNAMCCSCGGGNPTDNRVNLDGSGVDGYYDDYYYALGSMSIDGVDHWQVGRGCVADDMPCSLPSPRVDCAGENDVPVMLVVDYGGTAAHNGYQNEASWILENNNEVTRGVVPFHAYLCMDSTSTYTLNMYDSWGDGWNGNEARFEAIAASQFWHQECTLDTGLVGSCTFGMIMNCGDDHVASVAILEGDINNWEVHTLLGEKLFTRPSNIGDGEVVRRCLADGVYEVHLYSRSIAFDGTQVSNGGGTVSVTHPQGDDTYNVTCTLEPGACFRTCTFTVGSVEVDPLECTDTQVLVQISVHDRFGCGAWHGEIGWGILNQDNDLVATGGAPYERLVCMEKYDDYYLLMTDSYGDGWHGNEIVITRLDSNEILANCTVDDGVQGDCTFGIGDTSIDSSATVPFLVHGMLDALVDFSTEMQVQLTHAFYTAFCNYARTTAIKFVDDITQSEASIVCTLPEGIVYGNGTIHVNMYVAWSSADVIHANWGADLTSLSTHIRTLVIELASERSYMYNPVLFTYVYVTGIEDTPKQSSSSSALGTAGGIGVSVAAVVVIICVVFVSYFAYSRGYCSSKPTRQSRTLSGMVELSDDAKAPKHQLDPKKVKAADVVPDSVVVI